MSEKESPYNLVLSTSTDRVFEVSFDNENDGRTAWLLAIAGGNYRWAGLRRNFGAQKTRQRCEWSMNTTESSHSFTDRTTAHTEMIGALVEKLTREAPNGYKIELREESIWFVGGRTPRALGDVSANDTARILAHWRNYVPEGACVTNATKTVTATNPPGKVNAP